MPWHTICFRGPGMKLFLCAILSAAALASIGTQTKKLSPTSGSVPVEISVAGGTVGAGNTVSYRVVMDQSSSQAQAVAISASVRNAYCALPTVVVVPANAVEVVFQATISANPPGSWSIHASANGVDVSMLHTIDPSR